MKSRAVSIMFQYVDDKISIAIEITITAMMMKYLLYLQCLYGAIGLGMSMAGCLSRDRGFDSQQFHNFKNVD